MTPARSHPICRRSIAHQRRGITLLFVISMIVLFLLMGTTFVVVANQFSSSAVKRQNKDRYLVNHQPVIEKTLYDLLRGPDLDDATSPFRGHSLLEDMYGYGFSATVATSTPDSSGHFFAVTLNTDTRAVIDDSAFSITPIPGSLSGLVLSVVSGPAKGLTTRIVDHQVSGTAGSYTHRLVLLPHWMDNRFTVADAGAVIGSRVVINGRPFSGTGGGHFTPAAIDAAELSNEALGPNQIGRSRDGMIGAGGAPGYFSIGAGGNVLPNSRGPNESYDAFDFQNMFLAGLQADGTVIEPSFHRQTLVDHSPIPARADFRAFAAGGPANDGVMVDNNNDGIPEGIWMESGMPVQTTSDGRCYKPLVSVTVIDMDSRINANAHGNRSHLIPAGNLAITTIPTLSPVLNNGQGLGPAEIQMDGAFGAGSTAALLIGTGAAPGRYGPDGLPGLPGVRDDWSRYKLFGYPQASFAGINPGSVGGHFGSAMDIFGRFGFAYPNITDVSDNTTPIGLPMGNIATSALADEITDSPYEISFSDNAFFGPINQADRLFTPRELEAVLRQHDPDSNLLPRRLLDLNGGNFSGVARNLVTTSSFEVPTLPENMGSRLYQILVTNNPGGGTLGIPNSVANREQVIRDTLELLLPSEFQRGLPMNVNREFGDGVDNNSNRVVDEIGENDALQHPDGSVNSFDHDNDSSTAADLDTVLARASFARQLYILVLLTTERFDRSGDAAISVTDDWHDFNDDGTIDQQDYIDYRRLIAQWAVNVVDFRDPDSIMTPVEFDLNPFNGWDLDNDITTEESVIEDAVELRVVIWGSERPELLITETLATHDVRTQNLAIESTVGGEAPDNTPPDMDFDSHLVPKPSVFFELYNPWVVNDANQVRPGELYDVARSGVDLQRKSLDGTTPVWRLAVTEVDDSSTPLDETELDPDDPYKNPGGQVATLVRRIYFTRPDNDVGPEVFYPDDAITCFPVSPGRYAVVGSAGVNVGDQFHTYWGRRTGVDALDPVLLQDETRRLSLNPTTGELEILARSTIGASWQLSTRQVSVLPIGLNDGGFARDLGVSDPLTGYFNLTDLAAGFPINVLPVPDGYKFSESTTTGAAVDYAFDQSIDEVLDPVHFDDYLKDMGLKPGYRVVHLQRLANPLRPFDPVTNPYRTIDSSALDLFVFNGAESEPDPNSSSLEMRFGTSERRVEQNVDAGEVTANRHRLLFRNDKNGYVSAMARAINDFGGLDDHVFSRNLVESLGQLNRAYRDAGTADQRPFSWLQWNNRPFASAVEMVNVPFCSSFELTSRFSNSDAGRMIYEPDVSPIPETSAINASGHYAHLLNFYADKVDDSAAVTFAPSLHRTMSFLEVPSRYLGTEAFVNPGTFADNRHGLSFGLAAPFDRVSSYRYPGKININTITDQRVWNAVMGNYATTVPYATWDASRRGNSMITNFANPWRAGFASNKVPPGQNLVANPVDVSLFRRRTDTSGTLVDEPLFDYASTSTPIPSGTDDTRAAYFRYDMRQRMGNLTTNRSSVFGIWITVGYFEVDPNGTLKLDGSGQGIEVGVESGQVQRGRGFFLVDRSIPVASEPGQNHNVDRAILVKSIIE
ncbi:MAG: hypothetical protein AAFN77_08150 [Planctomycetota bacterium]